MAKIMALTPEIITIVRLVGKYRDALVQFYIFFHGSTEKQIYTTILYLTELCEGF